MILLKIRQTFKPGLAIGMGIILFFMAVMGMELLQETGRLKNKAPHGTLDLNIQSAQALMSIFPI